ncbi:MAG: BamA/TamA family outer membrane protein [Pseudomonadota bacterium]|nr:BamA/TamA family outer membrane protein [Pseudomonadota bacterium]
MDNIRRYTKVIALVILCSLAIAMPNINFSVSGISGNVAKNVLNTLKLFSENIDTNISENELRSKELRMEEEVKKAMQPFGYFNPILKSNIYKKDNVWYIAYNIKPGYRLRFNKVKLSPTVKKLTDKKHTLVEGEYFSIIKYIDFKKYLVMLAQNQGYANANTDMSKIDIDIEKKYVAVSIELNLGPRYHIGNINYNSEKISAELLNKFAPFKKGDTYTLSKIAAFKKNLEKSHLLQKIEIIPKFPAKNSNRNNIDLEVKLTLKPNNQYQVGFGYDTNELWQTNFNVTRNYLTKNANKSKSSIKIATNEVEAGFEYIMPGSDPIVETDIISSYLNTKSYQGIGDSKYITSSYIKKYNYINSSHAESINIHHEKSYPDNEPIYTSTLLYPKFEATRSFILNKKTKSKLSGYVLGAIKDVGSTDNILKGVLNLNTSVKLPDNFSFVNKIQLGAIYSNNFTDIPLSFKFTAGGANSLRGYSYNYFGPGKFLKVTNNEVSYRIYENLSVSFFVDIGNVSDNFDDSKYYVGIGPAISWHSQLGAVSLNLGYAISLDDKPWQLQMSFSPAI